MSRSMAVAPLALLTLLSAGDSRAQDSLEPSCQQCLKRQQARFDSCVSTELDAIQNKCIETAGDPDTAAVEKLKEARNEWVKAVDGSQWLLAWLCFGSNEAEGANAIEHSFDQYRDALRECIDTWRLYVPERLATTKLETSNEDGSTDVKFKLEIKVDKPGRTHGRPDATRTAPEGPLSKCLREAKHSCRARCDRPAKPRPD